MDVALIVVDLFVAVTAIGGGLVLAAGRDRRVDPAWLEGTPFSSYRLPGVLLAAVVGTSALVAAVAVAVDVQVGGILSVVAGLVLAGWILVEARILSQPTAPTTTELLYLVVGLVMIGLGLAAALG